MCVSFIDIFLLLIEINLLRGGIVSKSSLFWDFALCRLIFGYDVSVHRSHLQWSSSATSQKVEGLYYNAAKPSNLIGIILMASVDIGVCDL